MTDCGQKCFELRDTEYAFAVEKENNQKLEAEVKRLKGIIETPCTSCCITEDLEHSLDELNYQNINQDGEIRQLKVQIENLEKDKEWYKPEIEPEELKPILFRTVFGEYISGTFNGDDTWDFAGIAYYSTDQIEGWCYLPEWDTVKVN